ncbi:hypothetical protein A6J60_005300 [Psychrobacter sp. FDAARGOS_221]|nr:hypothetical protein A6J60_005300 [Psychrobacter sp. FDAARGOS_221]
MNNKKLLAFIAATLLLTACGSEPDSEPQNTNTDTQTANTEEVAPPGHEKMTQATRDTYVPPIKKSNFDITVQSYGKKINELLAGTEFADKTITDLSESDRDKVFITDYTHQISVVGEVNDEDKLQDLTYTMPVNDNIKAESTSLVELVSASMQVLNAEVKATQAKDETAKLIGQIVDDFEKSGEQQQAVKMVGDNVYAAQISDHGLRVVIQPKQDSRYVN